VTLAETRVGSRGLLDDTCLAGQAPGDVAAGRGPAWLDRRLAELGHELSAWYRHMHAHPELGRAETRTTELITTVLGSLGLRPQVLPGGTGVLCEVGSGPHTVALRADIDALPMSERSGLPWSSDVPGVAHTCGHDAHAAMLLGAAHALAGAPQLPGRVRLVFQPAEEVMPGGALDVIAAGGLAEVDRVFGLHCYPALEVGQVGTRTGPITSATDLLELHFASPGGHTSRPHLTADTLHALGIVITELPGMLSRRVDPRSGTVLVWGAVHAGEAANAIPPDGVLRGTLRTAQAAVWHELGPLISDLVRSLVAPTGVEVHVEHVRGAPPVHNDAASTELLEAGVRDALGDAAVTGVEQSSGGDDFAWYLEHVPGSFARLGVRGSDAAQGDIHRPTFALDERALPVGVRVLVHAALAALRRESAAEQ
jgi:amidohydrolase